MFISVSISQAEWMKEYRIKLVCNCFPCDSYSKIFSTETSFISIFCTAFLCSRENKMSQNTATTTMCTHKKEQKKPHALQIVAKYETLIRQTVFHLLPCSCHHSFLLILFPNNSFFHFLANHNKISRIKWSSFIINKWLIFSYK